MIVSLIGRRYNFSIKTHHMTETIIADLNNEQHVSDFMHVLGDYAEDPMGGGAPLSDYAKQNLIALLKSVDNNTIVLCYVSGKIAGIANCVFTISSFKAKPVLNIHDFAISPEFRGRGLSKSMLDRVEQLARDKGCCKLTLEVLENNHRAKKVYETFGFEGYELNPAMGKAVFWEKGLS